MDHAEGSGQFPWAHSQAETHESCPYKGTEGKPGAATAFFLSIRVARPTGLLLRNQLRAFCLIFWTFRGQVSCPLHRWDNSDQTGSRSNARLHRRNHSKDESCAMLCLWDSGSITSCTFLPGGKITVIVSTGTWIYLAFVKFRLLSVSLSLNNYT